MYDPNNSDSRGPADEASARPQTYTQPVVSSAHPDEQQQEAAEAQNPYTPDPGTFTAPDQRQPQQGYYGPGVPPTGPGGTYAPAALGRRGGVGRAVIITLILAILLGALLFAAGWQFGRGSTTGTLQAPSSNNTQVVTSAQQAREAAIAKVRP